MFVRSIVVKALVLTVAVGTVAACGKSTSPTEPSAISGAGTPPATTALGSAMIAGTVQGAGVASRLAETTGSLTVSVNGTTIVATVTSSGQFTLTGVPSGDITLRFHGGTTDATVTVSGVQNGETIKIVVKIQGTTADLDSTVRTESSGLSQLEGRVEALLSAASLTVAGQTVKTDGSTQIVQGGTTVPLSALLVGTRVHVAGTKQSDGILASRIELQNTNTTLPVNVNGLVSAFSGTASAFQLTVDRYTIKGDGGTALSGDGFSGLQVGSRVEVKGEQRDGYVYANSIHVNKAK